MLKKSLLSVILFISYLISATLTVGPTGSNYINILDAVNAASSGDIIEIQNGPRTYTLNSLLDLSTLSNITIKSTSSEKDTIERNMAEVIRLGQNITLENLYIRFTSHTASSTVYLITGNDIGGFTATNCVFDRNNEINGGWYKRGLDLRRSTASYNCAPSNISSCTFYGIGFGYTRNPDLLINNVNIYGCITHNADFSIGNAITIDASVFYGGMEVIGVRGKDILIENCLFNAQGAGEEYIGFDEAYVHAENVVIRNCIIDSSGHAPVLYDGCLNCEFSNNVITNGGYGYAYYNHHTNSLDSSDNIQIFNNTLDNGALLNHSGNGGPGSTNFSFRRNYMPHENNGETYSGLVINDTISHCVYANSNPSIYGFDVDEGNNRFGVTNTLIDPTMKYPFIKRNSQLIYDATTYAGARKFLLNIVGVPYNINATSFTIDDSISGLFWYNDPVNKDSGIVTLQTSTNINGPWSNSSVSTMQKAGEKSSLTATNLTTGKNYYRLTFRGNSNSNFICDTTEICSVTTAETSPLNPITNSPNKLTLSTNIEGQKIYISVGIEKNSDILLNLYNMHGKKVWSKSSDNLSKGYYIFQINKKVASGVYTLRLYRNRKCIASNIMRLK